MHVSICVLICVFKKMKAIQNNMLPRLKSATCNVLWHPRKNAIWSDSQSRKIMCNVSKKISRIFMTNACVRFSVNTLLAYLFIFFKTTTITYNAVHSKFMLEDWEKQEIWGRSCSIVSVDVSISANSQPMRAVESDHLLAYYIVMGDECIVDITNFLTDKFSVNKSLE